MTHIPDMPDIEWRISPGLTPYDQSLAEMEARAAAVAAGAAAVGFARLCDEAMALHQSWIEGRPSGLPPVLATATRCVG